MPPISDTTRYFWLSWWYTKDLGSFEIHTPWWISGERDGDGAASIVAAMPAMDESDAKQRVLSAYDTRPASLEWRFCEERRAVSPFSDRFRRAPWMRWDKVTGG